MQLKIRKRILCIFMVVSSLLGGIFISGENESSRAAATEDFKTFAQNDARWSETAMGNSSTTVSQAGCKLTSICMMMAWANPELRDVETFNPGIAAQNSSYFSGDLLRLNVTTQIDPKMTREQEIDLSDGSEEEAKQIINDGLDQGYFIIVKATRPIASGSSHWAPVIGRDENDDPNIVDSWRNQNTGEVGHQSNEWFNHITVIEYYRYDGLDSMDAFANATTPGSTTSQDVAVSNAVLVDEMYLDGMDEYGSYLAQDRQDITLPDNNVLSEREKDTLETIKSNKSVYKSTQMHVFGVLCSLLGFLVLVYDMLFIIGTILDYINEWVEFSCIKILTFGKSRLYKDNLGVNMNSSGVLTIKKIAFRVLILCIIGLILVSNLPIRILGRLF